LFEASEPGGGAGSPNVANGGAAPTESDAGGEAGDAGDSGMSNGGVAAASGDSATGGTAARAGMSGHGANAGVGGVGGSVPNGGTSGSADSSAGRSGGGSGSGGFAGVYGTSAPSCAGMDTDGDAGAGGIKCRGVSCCNALIVPGGPFAMGRSESGTDQFPIGADSDQPEHSVTVSSFALDEFEVTVGRFRRFVDQFDGTPPVVGAGSNKHIASSGWQQIWNTQLPADKLALTASLKCSASTATWTDAASYNEALPINCVAWFVAFAFCSWDGARLPTEAEWEFAAAGGDQNRLYPWGPAVPTSDLAVYNCIGGGTEGDCTFADIAKVGSRPNGDGRYGHADLAGSMWEHTRDAYDANFYKSANASSLNPVNLNTNVDQFGFVAIRGSSWVGPGQLLRSTLRNTLGRSSTYDGIGFRCARDP
jgi:formylglycine-generating enzyme required for sulfatase activity